MILLIHIVIALASIAAASFAFLKPSKKSLAFSYGFISATLASGTFLVVTLSSDLLRSCLAGLTYITVVSVVTLASHAKFKQQVAKTQL
jgi:hypothetical protein